MSCGVCRVSGTVMMNDFKITFGKIRRFCSVLNRISVCMFESQYYENFESIRAVPHRYDALYRYGFRNTDSGFRAEGRLSVRPCLEFALTERPRDCNTKENATS